VDQSAIAHANQVDAFFAIVFAVTEVWSGLKLVIPVKDRKKP
jgi:hypothetical protein